MHLVSLFSVYVVVHDDTVDVILSVPSSVLGMEKSHSCVPF